MIRYRHALLFAAIALSGCQTMSGLFQNRFASTPEYSTEEMLALSQPLPEATSPELGNGVMNTGDMNTGAGGQNANTMALASYNSANTPQQAGGNSAQSLVEAGQQAIRNAGQNNPSGLQQARQLFEQALGMDASNADAHHGIAIVADLQKDWASAEQHYKQALSGDPTNPSLLNDLGYSYLLQNRYHESQQYLSQAIQISPKHERAHLNLALLSLRRGNSSAARQTLAQVYSQQEIETNLSRLQQDLQKLNSDTGGTGAGFPENRGAMVVGQPQNGANAVYPVSQSQPADWNANRPPTQNFGQQATANAAYGAPAYDNGAVPPRFPAANGQQMYTDATGAMAIDPALRVSEPHKPISLYPPGVIRDEVNAGRTTRQNGAFSQGQGMSQNGTQAMANAGYPSSQIGNMPSGGQAAFQPFPAANPNGLQVPGANNASHMMNQYSLANSQPSANQFNAGPATGMNSSGGYGTPAMGLNVGPGMPFPIGGVAGTGPQQGQFNPQSQTTAQPLLNQFNSGASSMPGAGFSPAGYGAASYGSPNPGQPNYGQLPPNQNTSAANGQGQLHFSQLPGHLQPSGQMQNGNAASGQLNTQPVSHGQSVGAPVGFGPAGYGQANSLQNPMPGQFPEAMGQGAMNTGAMGQAFYPNVQPQHFGQGMNGGPGNGPGGMPQGMNSQFNGQMQGGQMQGGQMQGSPMQQFEQNQMNRINDQYQQALQQMNGRGFPGQ